MNRGADLDPTRSIAREGLLGGGARPLTALALLALTSASSAGGGVTCPDFTLDVSPKERHVCAPEDAVYTVSVAQIFVTTLVVLATANDPAGTSASFDPNPVSLPGTSQLTMGNTGSATPAVYTFDVLGTSPCEVMTSVVLGIYDEPPGALGLLAPANGAVGQSQKPLLTWTQAPGAEAYELEVVLDDASMTPPVYSATVHGLGHSPPPLAPFTTYLWRVRSVNPCGNGPFPFDFSFTTGADLIFADGFESGNTTAWTSSAP